MSAFLVRISARLAVVAVVIVLWWFASDVVFGSNAVVSRMGPLDAFSELVRLLPQQATLDAIVVSLWRLVLGLVVAAAIGVPLGALLGARALVEYATAPVVQFLRMTSPLAWTPLVLVLVGSTDIAVVALVALAAVWPIVLGTSAGVRSLDPALARVARSLGATETEALRTTIIPQLAPQLRTSLRTALGVAWIVLVPAEMLGVTNGLGYAVLNARDNVDYEELGALMILIGAIGFLLDRLLRTENGRGASGDSGSADRRDRGDEGDGGRRDVVRGGGASEGQPQGAESDVALQAHRGESG